MTISELHNTLKVVGISEDKYYLHGLYGSTNDDEKFALNIRKGKYAIEYEVYYKEKGRKTSSKIFNEEDEACEFIYKHLK